MPAKVGSCLSLNAIREDLEVSHRAVTHWMDILEAFYPKPPLFPGQVINSLYLSGGKIG